MTASRGFAGLALTALLATGCETLTAGVAAVDEELYEIVPTHPVTGRPVPNLVSEEQEVRAAGQRHQQLIAALQAQGRLIDPPGSLLTQIQRVFGRLLPVAHRQQLPWQVHLIDDPTVNAYTIGGGYVYVYEGLFGPEGHVAEGNDEELAAVLAHEIAHVTLLHVSLRQTWMKIMDRARKDPFYAVSFSTEQEAEADRLSVLYMALAGYDPQSGIQVWQRAHQRSGSDPAKGFYLHTHPLNAERVAIAAEASAQVTQYYTPGEQNPKWAEILLSNPLFPKTEVVQTPGAGLLKAGAVILDAQKRHEDTKEEAERREEAALRSPEYQSTLVQLVATRADYDAYGRPMIFMQFQNGSIYNVAALGVRVIYVGGQTPVAQDPNCGGAASIPSGQSVWLSCPYHVVPNATGYRLELTGITFQ